MERVDEKCWASQCLSYFWDLEFGTASINRCVEDRMDFMRCAIHQCLGARGSKSFGVRMGSSLNKQTVKITETVSLARIDACKSDVCLFVFVKSLFLPKFVEKLGPLLRSNHLRRAFDHHGKLRPRQSVAGDCLVKLPALFYILVILFLLFFLSRNQAYVDKLVSVWEMSI